MQMSQNKVYIDYLDYSVQQRCVSIAPSIRLKFDLLLFPQSLFCIAVPACVKLDSTTKLLMELTPFWNDNKISLVLDNKHHQNPWNYFRSREKKLERSFSEELLINHFEYTAYMGYHTQFFYNVYVPEVIKENSQLYTRKIFDTDELFRHSVVNLSLASVSNICKTLPITSALHISNILNSLVMMADDRRTLFQRAAVDQALPQRYTMLPFETNIVNRILDQGFARANALSSYAAPLSYIDNQLTALTFIPLLKSIDKELLGLISSLDWYRVYLLSKQNSWRRFVQLLNELLVSISAGIYQKISPQFFRIITAAAQMITFIEKLYDLAKETVRKKLLEVAVPTITLVDIENTIDFWGNYIFNRNDFIRKIKEAYSLIDVIKIEIKLLSQENEQYKMINENGFHIAI